MTTRMPMRRLLACQASVAHTTPAGVPGASNCSGAQICAVFGVLSGSEKKDSIGSLASQRWQPDPPAIAAVASGASQLVNFACDLPVPAAPTPATATAACSTPTVESTARLALDESPIQRFTTLKPVRTLLRHRT
uniref:Secreted protein n=1 Tax=Macrostomum lignano TaxID=282301 RepID=A0A1I8JN44_9PLAT